MHPTLKTLVTVFVLCTVTFVLLTTTILAATHVNRMSKLAVEESRADRADRFRLTWAATSRSVARCIMERAEAEMPR
jgi:hypothetical protein